MSVLIGCLECAEVFTRQAPDLLVDVNGHHVDAYRCPACGELNLVADDRYQHIISAADLAGIVAPEQVGEDPA